MKKQAVKDRPLIKSAGLEKKTRELIDIIAINPFQDPPPYEALVGNLSGFYSRRISIKHRLVYSVKQEKVFHNNGMNFILKKKIKNKYILDFIQRDAFYDYKSREHTKDLNILLK